MTSQRPDTAARSATAIRFPTGLHRRLRDAAAERGLSINWLVNRAVTEFLDRLLPVHEIVWTRPPAPLTRPLDTPQQTAPIPPVSDYVLGGPATPSPSRGPVPPVTLREACETGVLTVAPAVVRHARAARDPKFPQPVGLAGLAETFDPRHLQRWERSRTAAPTT